MFRASRIALRRPGRLPRPCHSRIEAAETNSSCEIAAPAGPASAVANLRRRGAVLVLAAFFLIVIFAFTAFTVDLGYIAVVKAELQNSADAAALAGAWELLDDLRAHGDSALNLLEANARQGAVQYAALNQVARSSPVLPETDVLIGWLNSGGKLVTGGDPSKFNTVYVTVSRTATKNGTVPLLFGPLLGKKNAALTATAVAAFQYGVTGFRPNERTGSSTLIPFTIQVDDWNKVLSGKGDDSFSANADTETVSSGSDGLKELKIFNGSATKPGNFGTLNIGTANLGLPDLLGQITNGVSEQDLAAYGGELKLDSTTKTLLLPGDTGFSTPVFEAAAKMLGKPVTIPLYSKVLGTGGTAVYTIVGFAGARIVEVVGSGGDKYITLQPAVVVDDSAIADGGKTSSYVYTKVKLVQ